MSEDILMSIKGMSGGYGKVPILHSVNIDIGANEVVGILGHNGMGKTTLLKTVMGFLPLSVGSIRFAGQDISDLTPNDRAALGLGYVPQGRGIFPQLSVLDNLRFAWQEYSNGEEAEVIEETLTHFPRLRNLLDREGGALSGGEQQLLSVARALVGNPEILLLDEPTEGIQPSIIEEMSETMHQIRAERGLSILLVEQNFDFIADLADRVLVLDKGRIVANLSKLELSDNAKIDKFLGFGAARSTRSNISGSSNSSVSSSRIPVTNNPSVTGMNVPTTVNQDSGQKNSFAHTTNLSVPVSQSFNHVHQNTVTNMGVKRPTLQQMRDMAMRFGMSLSDQELAEYIDIMEPNIQSYDRLDAMPDYLPEVRYPRAPGYRPDASENPLNAWYYKTEVKGAPDGPLRGKRIALKDTVCLAGVPMMNGSSVLEGYTPEIDATIVTRLLDAGAVIAGKAACEHFCLSGGSHTGSKGPIHNPYKTGYMAGGSSGGSTALVSIGEVDMAIAGDQGGSIRIPSSNCGVYGMKATHGLVPYSGVMPIEQTIDHVGPVTNNVADNALMLSVLAGSDDLDPRQYAPQTYRYTEAIGRGAHGLKIGILTEGFGRPESEADVDEKVLSAAEKFRELGARVENVSIPEHFLAVDCWTAIAVEGLQDHMMHGNSAGTNYRGLFLPSMMDHMSQWRNRADELSHSLKVCMFLGEFFQTQYRGRYYGKAQNLMRKVNQKYTAALQEYDLLLMPTVPMKPQPIPPADCSLSLYVQRAFEMIGNTAPFNCGLPAMSVPCGMSEGLPIGMMLVGGPYQEMKIYQAAHDFEKMADWRTM